MKVLRFLSLFVLVPLLAAPLQPCLGQVSQQLFSYTAKQRVVQLYYIINSLHQRDSLSFNKTIDSVRQLAQAKGDDKLDWYARLFKVVHLSQRQNNPSATVAILLQGMNIFEEAPFSEIKASYYFFLGNVYYTQHDFENAFHYLIAATDIFERIGYANLPLANKFACDLFGFYYNFEDYHSALSFLEIAIQHPDTLQSSPVFNLNNLGVTYLKLKNIAKAQATFYEVIQKAKVGRDTVYFGIGSGNYGNTLRIAGHYQDALPFLYTDLALNETKVRENSAITCVYIANCLAHLDSLIKADRYLGLALQLNQDRAWSNIYPIYYETKALYHKKKKEFSQASLYQDSLLDIKDLLKARFSTSLLMTTSLKSKEEKLLAEQRQKEMEAGNLRLKRNMIIGLLILIFAATLGYLYKKRQKERRQFEENQRRSANQLQEAGAKLEQYIKTIKEKNKLIEQIEAQLPAANEGMGNVEETTMQKLAGLVLLTEKDWHEFKKLFTGVWPNFFEQLHIHYPDLSNGEIRLLTLCKLQLSSREMAGMLGISLDSLRKSRYRLRKRLPQLLLDEEFKGQI